MTKDHMQIAMQYIAESVKKGEFLGIMEIHYNKNIDCSYGYIYSQYDSINELRFKCMCELAIWTKKDIDDFIEEFELFTNYQSNLFRDFRI